MILNNSLADILFDAFVGILAAVLVYIVASRRLKAESVVYSAQAEVAHIHAVSDLQAAASIMLKEQSEHILTLHQRVDVLERERESLISQIRALTIIIDSLRDSTDRERQAMQAEVTELKKKVAILEHEKAHLIQLLEHDIKESGNSTEDHRVEAESNSALVSADSGVNGTGVYEGQGAENRATLPDDGAPLEPVIAPAA